MTERKCWKKGELTGKVTRDDRIMKIKKMESKMKNCGKVLKKKYLKYDKTERRVNGWERNESSGCKSA